MKREYSTIDFNSRPNKIITKSLAEKLPFFTKTGALTFAGWYTNRIMQEATPEYIMQILKEYRQFKDSFKELPREKRRNTSLAYLRGEKEIYPTCEA